MTEPGYVPAGGSSSRRCAARSALPTIAEGSLLPAGSPLGSIRSRREEVHVSAAYDGVLAEWLVHEGDLVDAGDPIARLYPEVRA